MRKSRYLITPSLLNSFYFYQNYKGDKENEIRTDFLSALGKKSFEPNAAMQKGIDFEYLVQKTCQWDVVDWPRLLASKCQKLKSLNISSIEEANKFVDKNPEYLECVREMGERVKGGVWQSPLKKEVSFGDRHYLLYGRSDVIKENKIIDIKYTKSYDLGKFQASAQHRIYLECSQMPVFEYLITDGRSCWTETYYNHDKLILDIQSLVFDFAKYLAFDSQAGKLFYNLWKCYD